MTRYLRDANIISNVIKPEPPGSLLAWMGAQKDDDLFIASLTVAEIRRGILEKPRGKKRDALDKWFSGSEGPQALFAGRILSFDDKAGLIYVVTIMTAALQSSDMNVERAESVWAPRR
ncbi:hypothetical protein [Bradyrhizobium cosmicum]|uniref:hypothetical protein n=1 Tax=Bradyrhizobium cosmicum TaxID=1404864 RepID=UPI0028E856EB|nr:hypothetical protein [Bradyrhizobium cosmicum]